MNRPFIGIAGYHERARWNIYDTDATVIHQAYVQAITAHGGRALILPPDEQDAGVIDRLDGLLLPGGPDVDPVYFGQRRHPETDRPSADRDSAELLLLRAALERDLPVLGVCRGLQLLAIVYGGTLHQHLPDLLGHKGHCPREGVLGEHAVRFAEHSLARAVYGPRAVVNSHHHQGVTHGGALRVTGHSDDGLAEAVEDPAKQFVLGVQWHPELSEDEHLFAAFVASCARRPADAFTYGFR
ncbi:gamma-glutamyl-gamma-aminobutyrate hydrolase family protein [Sphaerisporangium aureirubrum]|uniref:Gamma-glutamyl-gamma-aminobutyrate hydrolase family protein n=1 Tax=Sphaerisporangium aureirubrum TaxID=1544736 RepID=A0ABW1NC33_9ACTN